MFLNNPFETNDYKPLNEAESEIDEPTEADAEFDTGEETEVSQTTDDGEPGDDTSDTDDMDSGGDDDFGGDSEGDDSIDMDDESEDDEPEDQKVEATSVEMKKANLLEQLEVAEYYHKQLNEALEHLDVSNLNKRELGVYSTIEKELYKVGKQINTTLIYNFKRFKYERLLLVYMSIKQSLTFISEILKKLSK